jgi:hypothetical protein
MPRAAGADRADVSKDPSIDNPIDRARRLLQRAVPVIRDMGDAIERRGGIERMGEQVVEQVTQQANEIVRRVDDAMLKATAVEGIVIERTTDAAGTDAPAPVDAERPDRRRWTRRDWMQLAVVSAAATYGALRLQGRPA